MRNRLQLTPHLDTRDQEAATDQLRNRAERGFFIGPVTTGEGVISPDSSRDGERLRFPRAGAQSSEIQTIESRELKDRIARLKQDLQNDREGIQPDSQPRRFFTGEMQPSYLTRARNDEGSCQKLEPETRSRSPDLSEDPSFSRFNFQAMTGHQTSSIKFLETGYHKRSLSNNSQTRNLRFEDAGHNTHQDGLE